MAAAKQKKSNFLADVWYELTTKVVWPTWSRLRVATIVVVGFITLWALLLYGFDTAFTWFQGRLVDDAVVQKQWAEIQERNAPAEIPEDGLPNDSIEFPVDDGTTEVPESNQ